MADSQKYLHSDSLDGRQLSLAINQPLIATESKGWGLATRLYGFLKSESGRYLLVHEGAAWCSERPATVVGAQCLAWEVEGDLILLCWPLDNSVYFCHVDTSGFNLIVPDSELVCSYDDAIKVLNHSQDQVVIVPGGTLSSTLGIAGYPANSADGQVLSDSRQFRTSSPFGVFTRLHLPHPGHAGIFILLLLMYLLYVLYAAWTAPLEVDPQNTVITVTPATGHASLEPALISLRRRLRELEMLTLYGLQRIEYSSDTAAYELHGETTIQRWPRLESVLRQFKAVPEATGKVWEVKLPDSVLVVEEQNLLPIHVELSRLLRLAMEAGMTIEIVGSRNIAGVLSVTSRRFRTRRSTELELELATPVAGVATSLPVLVAHLAELRPAPTARLVSARILVANDGSMDARINIIIKGKPREATI